VRVLGRILSAAIDGIPIFSGVDGGGQAGRLSAGTVALEAFKTPGNIAVEFDDVEVVRLHASGQEAERLLREPFTPALPGDWIFTDGTRPWAISPNGHPTLDLTGLLNATLRLDYLHIMKLN
jgi:hypothetical protein